MEVSTNNQEYICRLYTSTQRTESSSRGLYGITKTQDKQLYADFLVGINKYFGEDWSLQANVGGSLDVYKRQHPHPVGVLAKLE